MYTHALILSVFLLALATACGDPASAPTNLAAATGSTATPVPTVAPVALNCPRESGESPRDDMGRFEALKVEIPSPGVWVPLGTDSMVFHMLNWRTPDGEVMYVNDYTTAFWPGNAEAYPTENLTDANPGEAVTEEATLIDQSVGWGIHLKFGLDRRGFPAADQWVVASERYPLCGWFGTYPDFTADGGA